MLASLKFVQGAVAKKDFVPALTHYRIENGTVRGYNGILALCSPIPMDIECTPRAEPMVKAISYCEDTVSMSLTPTGKLSIKSGAFKALVDCVEGPTPHVVPEGDTVQVDGASLIAAFKAVWPFVGNDASRPWSNGVLLQGQSAFATNNVTLVEYWVGGNFPKSVNIPRAAVQEMIRINEPPISAQLTDTSITFHYEGNRWIRTQLFSLEWPDLGRVLDRESTPVAMEEQLFVALEKLQFFVDKSGRIFFKDGIVRTHADYAEGATYEIATLQHEGIFNIDMLKCLSGVAQTIDWSLYPGPCMFFGERLRGAIIGMRM